MFPQPKKTSPPSCCELCEGAFNGSPYEISLRINKQPRRVRVCEDCVRKAMREDGQRRTDGSRRVAKERHGNRRTDLRAREN